MKNNATPIKSLLCLVLVAAWSLLAGPGSAQCQTSTNWTILAQVTDTGGGVCDSANYRLCYSLGQTSAVGVSDSTGQSLSGGFITGMASQVQAAAGDSNDDLSGGTSGDSSDDSTGNSSTGSSGDSSDNSSSDSSDSSSDGSSNDSNSGGSSSCFIKTLISQ